MRKKIVSIISKVLCVLLVLIVTAYIGIGFFGGFNLKSGACAGGYRTFLYDCELENIKAVCNEELTEEQLAWIKANLTLDRDNNRIMVTKYTDSNGQEVRIQCKMKWYWSNNYEWSKQ